MLDSFGQAKALTCLHRALSFQNRNEEASKALKLAIAIGNAATERKTECRQLAQDATDQLATFYLRNGEVKLAEEYAERYMNELVAVNDGETDLALAWKRDGLGRFYERCQNLEKARAQFKLAAQEFRALNDPWGETVASTGLGRVLALLDHWSESADVLEDAVALSSESLSKLDDQQSIVADKINDKENEKNLRYSHERARRELGLVYRSQGRQADAEGLFRQALAEGLESDRHMYTAWNFVRIARAYSDVHNFVEAEKLVRDALSNPERVSSFNAFTRLGLWVQLANILAARGEGQEAVDVRHQIVEELKAGKVFNDAFDELVRLECEVRTGGVFRFEEFHERLEQVRSIASDDFENAWRARVLGLACERDRRTDEAIHWYRIAAEKRWFYNEFHNGDWAETRLLELCRQTDCLAQAQKFFEELLQNRQGRLDARHPAIAFTQVRLARTLMLQDRDMKRTLTLLHDAQSTLIANELTPDSIKQEVAGLIAEVQP